MPTWPANLPQFVNEAGYSESLEDQTIESSMDTGSAKVRRRFTAAFRKFSVSLTMDPTQAAAFETFYLTTLQGGSLPFDWVHPRTRVAKTFRFRKPAPQVTVAGSGQVIRYNLTIESMP